MESPRPSDRPIPEAEFLCWAWWKMFSFVTGGSLVRVPISASNPPCIRSWCTLNPSGSNVFPLVLCGSLKRLCQLRYHPCHLTTAQKFMVRHNMALV
ncbi:hypothetical protein AVEN_52787-1 [Araneus ventricosus]|uniref:Uncharacterized protein n=1 Tax=Araneus ventricosus TaxID=182803 RepID=A0A4Y2CY99_ARAVE|nr:hypothetical protein AVEN_52787-1 [Araneus ventricosus]